MSMIELPPGMAPGFRFHPTDEELITDYLKPKILGTVSEVDRIIAEVDFCKFEPAELPLKSKIKSKDRIWFFFCEERMKYANGKGSKRKGESNGEKWKITGRRTTKGGFWKITGKERVVKDEETKEFIGKKRSLVFHKGSSASGVETNWVMQQYYIVPDNPLPNQKIHVLCRLKKKPDKKANSPDSGEGEPSSTVTSDVENPVTPAATPWAHGHEEVHQESYSGVCNFTGEEFAISQPSYYAGCKFTDEELALLSPMFRDPKEVQGLHASGEQEEHPKEAMNSCIPQASSCKRWYGDDLVGGETDTEGGVDGGGKRPCSLARGDIH